MAGGLLRILKTLFVGPERRHPPREQVDAPANSDNPGGVFLDTPPEWFEEKYAEGSRSREVDRYYFHLMDPLQKAIRSGDCAAVIRYSKESLPLLGAVIQWQKKDSETFDITEIPAIDPGGRIMAAMGDVAGVRAIKAQVMRYPELEPWRTFAAELLDDVGLAERILLMVSQKPGSIIQKDLKKLLPVDAGRIRDLCYWMAKGGRLRREKAGSSYKLFAELQHPAC